MALDRNPLEHYYEETGIGYRMSSTRRDRVLALVDKAIRTTSKRDLSILDIGIGNAEVAEYVRKTFSDRKIAIVGVDIAPRLVEERKALYDETLAVNVDDTQWTARLSRHFDIIVASELIEHLFRPDLFLQRMRTVLNDGGQVVLSTPNMLLWSQRIRFLLGRHGYSDKGVFEWGHIHLFSWGYLQQQLRENKFSIVETNHLVHPYALRSLHRVLPAGLFAFQFIVLLQKQ